MKICEAGDCLLASSVLARARGKPAAALRRLGEADGLDVAPSVARSQPSRQDLTTQEAAEFLGVSRSFFVKLLKANDLIFH
jgi:hypothetical protein